VAVASTRVVGTETETIELTTPVLPSGRTTVTVQNRGGLAQRPLVVDAVALASLPAGSITTVAGGTTFAGDGGAAAQADVAQPHALVVDAAGNLYVADTHNHRIRKMNTRTGIIHTVAGTGQGGFSGDGGIATAAKLTLPQAIALDAGGNLYIADSGNNRIRRVDAATGVITTFAGGGEPADDVGDGLPATQARVAGPTGLAVAVSGELYIADTEKHRVRRVAGGVITTVAGTGRAGWGGDGGPAVSAALDEPRGLALDRAGNLFIADGRNLRVRRVDAASRAITTVAGNGSEGFTGDDRLATDTAVGPKAVVLDADGNLYIADAAGDRIRRVDAATGRITTLAGGGIPADLLGDGGPALAAMLHAPHGVALDAAGNLLIADTSKDRVRRVDAKSRVISTIAGTEQGRYSGDGGAAIAAALNEPYGVAVDASGNVYVADRENNRVRRVDGRTGQIATFAGTGRAANSGDGGPAVEADLTAPESVAVGPGGDLYVAVTGNHKVRRISAATGRITTVAGTGEEGASGDGGPALAARLNVPCCVALDSDGNVFVSDTGNDRVRRVDAASGAITAVPAGALSGPRGLALDRFGILYVADGGNDRVLKMDLRSQAVSVVARGLSSPRSVAVDAVGNVFVASGNNVLYRIDLASGAAVVVAGTGEAEFGGDNGPAVAAALAFPYGIALDAAGNLYIADTFNHRLRAVRGPVR
jgi:sugar lactone lactonase YvrE